MNMVRRIIFLLLGFALLVGCASAPVNPTATSKTQGSSNRYLVYTRSGGIAGRTNTWTIYADGRIQADNGLKYQTSSQETTTLFDQLPLTDFIEQSKATPEPVCPDCTTATLQYHEGDKTYELTLVLEKTDSTNPVRAWVEKIEKLLANSSMK
jgi:hypothetical protein